MLGEKDLESENFELLENTDVTTFLIDRPWITYRSNADLDSLGARFGSPNPEGSNRLLKMSSIIKSTHAKSRTESLLSFIFSPAELRPVITEYLTERQFSQLKNIDDFILDRLTGDNSKDILIVAQAIKQRVIKEINSILLYSNVKLISSDNSWDIVPEDEEITITVPIQRINEGYISNLLTQGLNDLEDGDFDSIVTKSRTLIEEVFLQILADNDVECKRNGNINQYRNLVVEKLRMRPSQEWNPRITKMIGHLNGITDLIAEMRNKDSDAHASSERVKIQAAEAELLLNTSVSLATYYLRINDRHPWCQTKKTNKG